MSLLEDLRETLAKFDDRVYYGALPIDRFDDNDPWDFIVFQREDSAVSGNCTSEAKAFIVIVSRENFIPEGLPEGIIKAVCDLPGMKLSKDSNIEFSYGFNPNSHESVEACALHFRKGAKL